MSDIRVDICAAALEKPEPGAACNRCGLCCLMEQCDLSLRFFGEHERCPALDRAGDAYACGLITDPERHLGVPRGSAAHFSRLFGDMLGVGTECDSVAPWEEKPA